MSGESVTAKTIKAIQTEAYRQGAKDYAEEVRLRARRMAGKRNAEYRDFGAAFMELEYETTRGEWPKETTCPPALTLP